MIIREWRGRAVRQRSDAYPKHFRERILPELQKIPASSGHICLSVNWSRVTRWNSSSLPAGSRWKRFDHSLVQRSISRR